MAYPQVTFAATTVHDSSLVGRRRKAVAANTLRYQLDVLKKTGRYEAFKLQCHPTYDNPPVRFLVWPVPDHLFWDSDVAKWIEGACYFLKQQSLPDIDAAVKELVDMIRSAQQPDGYLNIHYTVVQPGKRFTNLKDMHELYNAGHLIEAALAHQDVYQNHLLMEPVLKYVDLFCRTFGPGPDQTHGYPGHPEIELSLLRLYERTKEQKHLDLATYFVTERGNPKGVDGENYFVWEARQRGDDAAKRPAFYPESECLWYHQAHAPIEEQQSVEGHSVRAMYLLTSVADLCRLETSTPALQSALYRLWDNMTQRKMYVTGGIGAIKQWEGFGQDYYLPQGTDEGGCYSETCASIGIMMLAQRILQFDLDAKFADIMELCLYNAVLTAMSHDGKGFTYVNQLASSNADPSRREDWFTVACCPPNMLRLLGSIGGYIWTTSASEEKADVLVNLYIPSTVTFSIADQHIKITQQSDWPWTGDITFEVDTQSEKVGMKLRIPEWAPSFDLQPPCPDATLTKGYLNIPPQWIASHRTFKLAIPLKPRWIAPHPFTNQNTLSLARGPVIYCVEDVDNPWVDDHFKSVMINDQSPVTEKLVTDKLTEDRYIALKLANTAKKLLIDKIEARPSVEAGDLEAIVGQAEVIPELTFVPYYFRANRGGKGHMRVGLTKLRQ